MLRDKSSRPDFFRSLLQAVAALAAEARAQRAFGAARLASEHIQAGAAVVAELPLSGRFTAHLLYNDYNQSLPSSDCETCPGSVSETFIL
jgi:hypothetical protein